MNLFSSHHARPDGRHRGITVRRGIAAVAVFVTIIGAPLVVLALAADDGEDGPSTDAGVVVSDQGSFESGDDAARDDRTDPTPPRSDGPDASVRQTEEAAEQETDDQVTVEADATDLDEPVDTVTEESVETVTDEPVGRVIDSPAETVVEDAAFSRAAADATGPDLAAIAALDRLEFLTASYTWDEQSLRVAALQQVLEVDVDGWYSPEIRLLHLQALQLDGLGTDGVPEVPPPGPSADQWAALRDCESGGDYSIASSSGRYRGAYQFARTTWDSVAGRNNPSLVGVDPASAAPADQDAMARALYSEAGHGPWPVCGRHLR